jgi:glycosyltransferase involved in cell wall biosynthesis
MGFRDVRVVCTTPTQHRALVAQGIPAARCVVIRPAVDAPRVAGAARADVRSQLGLSDDDFVLLASGESTRAAAHERAVWVGSILHVTDERYRVLLWGRGRRLDAATGLGRKLAQRGLVISAERALGRPVEYADLAAAADAALVTADAPAATLPVSVAMAAGVPVVSAERPELAELIVDGVTGLTVAKPAPRLLAQRVLDLRAQPALARALAGNAERRVEELYSPAAYVQSHRALYGLSASDETPASSLTTVAAVSSVPPGAMRAPAPPSP